ncbi:MAG TPA: hypothetical protein PLW60_03335, partial [Bacilli bacterium]|nr:hypothetical protein [Bacilli bacterium]
YNRTIDGIAIVGSQSYQVATIDFVYENYAGYFSLGTNVVITDDLFRDCLAQEVKATVLALGKWYLQRPIND